MKPTIRSLFSALIIVLLLSCTSSQTAKPPDISRSISHSQSIGAPDKTYSAETGQPSFEDRTQQIVSHAAKLVELNEKEGATLDQRWYGLKYFGKHQDLIFNAAKAIFFGGLEDHIRHHIRDRYTAIDPVEDNQDPGDIRMYIGRKKKGDYDFIVVGQNGREVALKRTIRLLYVAKFVDEETRRKYDGKLRIFKSLIRVWISSVSAKEEYIEFFKKHRISNPDAVMIGFRGDIRSLLKEDGIGDPESYTDESLRVNWYPDANGKKVLLVSIDKNRIFASRAGELIEAIFEISAPTPPSITLLGSGGAIDAAELVGQIVTPISVMNGDLFVASGDTSVLIHIIRNQAADEATTKTANVSVESCVVETTRWVIRMKALRLNTVDQELFHIMNAINSSPYATKVAAFIGTLVTDNVSSNLQRSGTTLEYAEEVISATAEVRRGFLSKVLKKLGILRNKKSWISRGHRPAGTVPVSLPCR